jgi:tetratricopeptide (TPR) repeat protein
MRTKPLSKAEAQFLADAVEKAKSEQAAALYVQGLDSERLQRWQEAATAFEESLRYSDESSAGGASSEAAARQRVPQTPQAEGRDRHPRAAGRVDDDRDAQDDALEQLAWCQTEIESYNDAKNTWRTLLRRVPRFALCARGEARAPDAHDQSLAACAADRPTDRAALPALEAALSVIEDDR